MLIMHNDAIELILGFNFILEIQYITLYLLIWSLLFSTHNKSEIIFHKKENSLFSLILNLCESMYFFLLINKTKPHNLFIKKLFFNEIEYVLRFKLLIFWIWKPETNLTGYLPLLGDVMCQSQRNNFYGWTFTLDKVHV